MYVNSRLKATEIIVQMRAFYRQRIPDFSCAMKETVDINILVKSKNGDWKIMQSIGITSRPLENTEVEPVEPVQMDIYESNTYRRLKLVTFRRWTRGSREAASERSTVLHIHFCSLSIISK